MTLGLSDFGLMELEASDAHEPPNELMARLTSLAEYLIENGPVIKNGDTVGEDAQEKIRVAYKESAFRPMQQVMRLVYDGPAVGQDFSQTQRRSPSPVPILIGCAGVILFVFVLLVGAAIFLNRILVADRINVRENDVRVREKPEAPSPTPPPFSEPRTSPLPNPPSQSKAPVQSTPETSEIMPPFQSVPSQSAPNAPAPDVRNTFPKSPIGSSAFSDDPRLPARPPSPGTNPFSADVTPGVPMTPPSIAPPIVPAPPRFMPRSATTGPSRSARDRNEIGNRPGTIDSARASPTRPPSPTIPETAVMQFGEMGWTVKSLAYAPDDSKLAVGKMDRTLKVFDTKSGGSLGEIDDLKDLSQVTAVAFSPDGNSIYAGGYTGAIQKFSLGGGTLVRAGGLQSHSREVTCLLPSANGSFIISGDSGGQVSWQQIVEGGAHRSLDLHKRKTLALHLFDPPTTALSTNGNELCWIDLIEATIKDRRIIRRGYGHAAAISLDGKRIAVSYACIVTAI